MSPLFQGKSAVVSGATSGVGQSVATMLLEQGARVVCIGRREDVLAAFETRFGQNAIPMAADLSSEAEIDELVLRIEAACPTLDILVNSAGHNEGGKVGFGAGPTSDWQDVLAVNLEALMHLTHRLIPRLRADAPGHVVNVGSIVARSAAPNMAAYIASKHGVHGFSEALRADYDDGTLRVTEVLPGTVRTGFAERRWGGIDEAAAFYDRIPAQLAPDDIARSVVWALQQPVDVMISEIVVVPTRRR